MLRNLFPRKKTENKEMNWEIPLPDVVVQTVFEYCDPKEQKHFLFARPSKAQRLLLHVAYDEQEKVEAILKKEKDDKAIIQLLSQKNDVIDPCGRMFYKITVFQYALWAFNIRMWKKLLQYFSRDEKEVSSIARKQLEELELLGVEYKKSTSADNNKVEIIKGEKHFDFSPLINALQDYVNNYNAWNYKQRVNHWRKEVVAARQYVPVCHPTRSLNLPEFNKRYLIDADPEITRGLADLGIDRVISLMRAWLVLPAPLCNAWMRVLEEVLPCDLAALNELRKKNTKEFEMLKNELQVPLRTEALRLTPH